jgi:hypothetical protein
VLGAAINRIDNVINLLGDQRLRSPSNHDRKSASSVLKSVVSTPAASFFANGTGITVRGDSAQVIRTCPTP